MFFSSSQIVALALQYRYVGIFLVMIVEGPIVTVIASFLSSTGYFNVFAIFGLGVLGDLVGDSLYYAIGYWGGRPMIERWGARFGATSARMKKAETYFSHHSGKTLITAKLTHGLGMWVLLGAGAARADFLKFLWYNFIGTVPKVLLFVLLGYFFGRAYDQIGGDIGYVSVALVSILLVGLIIFLLRRRRRH